MQKITKKWIKLYQSIDQCQIHYILQNDSTAQDSNVFLTMCRHICRRKSVLSCDEVSTLHGRGLNANLIQSRHEIERAGKSFVCLKQILDRIVCNNLSG